MENFYIFIIVIFFIKLILFALKILFSDNTLYPDISKQSVIEVYNLSDKYCYGDGVEKNKKIAKFLLEYVVRYGTDNEKKKALEYAEDYCGSIFKDLVTLARSIGFIHTGIGH